VSVRASRPPGSRRDPVAVLGALSAGVLLVAVVLFAAGGWIAGLILLGLAVALLTLCVSGAKHEPDHPAGGPVRALGGV
jgi:hypothetical protein